ncbi:MAG: HAMP domain-containing sensor histidine kinase [Bacteroidales bacterium]|nr:HAMP domain-containing sensor histidine kinase [Bacteroidales bacterium]
MKNRKLQIGLITLTILSLIALLGIQVSWIIKAANMQERQFSHSVKLAINHVVEQMADDQSMCKEVANCMGASEASSCSKSLYNNINWSKVDSLIKNALNQYHINIDYEFDIVDTQKDDHFNVCNKSYFSDNLENVILQNAIELKIRFPKKSEFIVAQIGLMFISSIILIVLISFSFILILKYYMREKTLYKGTRDFINNITHEFKTPITNIALANSMISKNKKIINDEKLNQYSNIIKDEQKKLKNRVEGLLAIARIEDGNNKNYEIINICDFIQYTVDSYKVQIQELNGTIKYEKLSDKCTVHGDKEQFQTAISNLIDNAIKYCENKPEIIIKAYNKGENIFIEVEDNGIGIKNENIKQIFEKYFRVPTGDVHNVKGFGIGLSTVKTIVDSLNGEISVLSKLGKGSIFIIKLPYCC